MTTNDNPSRTIKLKPFRWILDVSDNSLSITIDNAQTVDDLKEAILKLKSNTFANIEADQLVLWKVVLSSSSKSYYSLLLKSSILIRSPRVLKKDIAKQDFSKTMRWRRTLYQTILLHPNPRRKPFTLSYECLSYGEPFIAHHFYSVVPPPKPQRPQRHHQRQSLHHVDAHSLHLCHVSIPVDANFKDDVSKVVREEKGLSPVDMLSSITPRQQSSRS